MKAEFVIHDILYGKVSLPRWLRPALSLPEFARLRAVRQSNLDSLDFKDFSSPSRWSHGLGAAYLASLTAKAMRLDRRRSAELLLAALLHDVATPPFGHTAEQAIAGFDHEVESQRLLLGRTSDVTDPGFPVFESELGRFGILCDRLGKELNVSIDPEAVAGMIVGEGDLGYLIAGTIDLDNADNVTRALLYLGYDVDRELPKRLAVWLASCGRRPLELRNSGNADVNLWLDYRDLLYASFFFASHDELGRQAFLEHLMRRAIGAGLPPRTLVWATDDDLLRRLEAVDSIGAGAAHARMGELVNRYRLLETPHLVAAVPLQPKTARSLANPSALRWVEEALSGDVAEVMVTLQRPRFTLTAEVIKHLGCVYSSISPTLYIYSLSSSAAKRIRDSLPHGIASRRERLEMQIAKWIQEWEQESPWMAKHSSARRLLPVTLDSVGDWSFRLSRNESFHPYPSTFVHALPSTLLRALELKGALILDPFCGTGETVLAGLRIGSTVLASDVNRVALLVASARVAVLSKRQRRELEQVAPDEIMSISPADAPAVPGLRRWHHAKTEGELRRILAFCESIGEAAGTFAKAAFSAILPLTTARRGKQNSYFADNTPLAAGVDAPPYVNAYKLFTTRLRQNIRLLEKLYGDLERQRRDPLTELGDVQFARVSARKISCTTFGMKPGTLDAVVTSPPYLCAVDYTLGSRLSYYWLFPNDLEADFDDEIGARRRRSRPSESRERYIDDLREVACALIEMLRPGGLVAMVVGEPRAKAFRSAQVLATIDAEWEAVGLRLVWSRWRPVQWHRNHGYASIMNERVSLYERQ